MEKKKRKKKGYVSEQHEERCLEESSKRDGMEMTSSR